VPQSRTSEITLFFIPIPNSNSIPNPVCQNMMGETDMTDMTAKG